MNRRDFTKLIGMGASAAMVTEMSASPERKIKIGHTCITWGVFPKADAKATMSAALKDISAEGFWSYETFPDILETLDDAHELTPMMERYGVPLRSGYITVNVIDSAQRKDNIHRVTDLSKVIQKYKGTFIVLAPNGVKRESYSFQEHRQNIVASLNDYAKAVTDIGLGTGLHQHTGTAIETRDEVYAVMEAVDTKYMKFAPDVGQLQKGGADAAKVVKDFLPILKHMHLKDYKGWEHYAGYCPIGMGQVDIKAVLDMSESSGQNPDILVELDPSANAPFTPLETAQKSKAYLETLGYKFKS
jgi:inosose dehydratase